MQANLVWEIKKGIELGINLKMSRILKKENRTRKDKLLNYQEQKPGGRDILENAREQKLNV